MTLLSRPAVFGCMAALALTACDVAEFDKDPEVRREARAARTCISAVKNQTKSDATLNTTLPVIEVNQYIVDAPALQERWMCVTDDEGNAQQLVKMDAS